ncbi:MAG: ribosomal-protein-alanine N-acetyltransferase [Erysipelotrichia bacterium]|nr:ribosomal-protein-alanine N-acetyltransferase [Erysipelotrichia bacterium]NCC55381.1 ribosomal-protein-alanine N-acetyltransferase [Erysipelotrichia bacterium]
MIRKMTIEDLDRIDEIEQESFSSVYKIEQYAYEIEDNPCAKLFVLMVEEKIVGFIDYWITFDSCQLTKLAIAKEERGKGYAHTLMQFMIEDAINENCEAILLEVRESNTIAKTLYEAYDFLEINRRKGYYSDNHETAIVTGKAIGGL